VLSERGHADPYWQRAARARSQAGAGKEKA
jgi:hypothetical protein